MAATGRIAHQQHEGLEVRRVREHVEHLRPHRPQRRHRGEVAREAFGVAAGVEDVADPGILEPPREFGPDAAAWRVDDDGVGGLDRLEREPGRVVGEEVRVDAKARAAACALATAASLTSTPTTRLPAAAACRANPPAPL